MKAMVPSFYRDAFLLFSFVFVLVFIGGQDRNIYCHVLVHHLPSFRKYSSGWHISIGFVVIREIMVVKIRERKQ